MPAGSRRRAARRPRGPQRLGRRRQDAPSGAMKSLPPSSRDSRCRGRPAFEREGGTASCRLTARRGGRPPPQRRPLALKIRARHLPIFCGFNQPEAGRRGLRPAIFVFPLLEPASRAYGEKRSVRPGPISRSSGNAERLGRQAETAFRGGARWRSPVGAFAAGRPGGLPRHMRRAPSPGPAAAPPEQRRDGRRSAGDIGS
mmetsp:Transcript_5897/g.17691  ORF Transcript_5897/g.17691 Transcript_5897/m.17691 type:complete len:200 (+) Transcript_5897:500-1099(+)